MDPPRLAEVPNVPIWTLVREISVVLYVNNHASKTILRKLQIISYSSQTAIAACELLRSPCPGYQQQGRKACALALACLTNLSTSYVSVLLT